MVANAPKEPRFILLVWVGEALVCHDPVDDYPEGYRKLAVVLEAHKVMHLSGKAFRYEFARVEVPNARRSR